MEMLQKNERNILQTVPELPELSDKYTSANSVDSNHISGNAWQNLQKDLCNQQRLRSACTSVQSDQSLCWTYVPSTAFWLSKQG